MDDMKVVILAGGFGTRISEESHLKPKPMVEIGGKPILWHIMKIYSYYGYNDFIICLGYKGYIIKEYFANYFLHNSDVTLDLKKNSMEVHQNHSEPWKITLIETGEFTQTGGRLKRVKDYIGGQDFCFTYGDGVSDVNIKKIIEFHQKQNTLATLTAVKMPGRFGKINMSGSKIVCFQEKPEGESGWVNGGFFVLSPGVFDYIEDDDTVWERTPLERLASDGNLSAYVHDGFWHMLDTLRDKIRLEELWNSGKAPWKIWP